MMLISDKRVRGKGGEYHTRERRFESGWKDTGGRSNFMYISKTYLKQGFGYWDASKKTSRRGEREEKMFPCPTHKSSNNHIYRFKERYPLRTIPTSLPLNSCLIRSTERKDWSRARKGKRDD